MNKYTSIKGCRACKSPDLVSVLHLGHQALTGVFPRHPEQQITVGPLELVWCGRCGLLQLNHSFDPGEMYGENYGYRSGLNQSMVQHLQNKVRGLERLIPLQAGDVVLDIGSNDCTLLKSYSTKGLVRVGIDPTGSKFKQYYPDDVKLVPDFFSSEAYARVGVAPARVVTSIAMFYDLEDPIAFARQVAKVLRPDGVWHFEQSYMPSMLRTNSYDTICHEHLEYYSLGVIQYILEQADMVVADVHMNSVNGGSFAITASKKNSDIPRNNALIHWMLEQETRIGLNTPHPLRVFEERVFRHREDLRRLVNAINQSGKTILGYGASTKGNVLLQFCGFTSDDIAAIAEVNPDKFGAYTPGTKIPIISEQDARARHPDYFLVLPWHFKDSILQREQEFLARGGKFIFPFPEIEII